jgi:hypothetical protein
VIYTTTSEDVNSREYWSIDFLIEETFLQLAETKQTIIINYNYGGLQLQKQQAIVSKYYRQAEELKHRIPIGNPTPEFMIDVDDLNDRLIAELHTIDNREYVLKQAVSRIFENIDSRYYHLSIAQLLKVRLVRK